MKTNYIDIGINLMNKQFRNEINNILIRAIEANVTTMLLTGTSVSASEQAYQLTQKYKDILYATAGIHPHNAKSFDVDSMDQLRVLLKRQTVLAVGECGLDFDRDFSPRPIQETCFEAHLQLAIETQKPLFLHERAAFTRFNEIMGGFKGQLPHAVVHCFTGTLAAAKTYLDQGFFIGFTGAISDAKRFSHLRDVVKYVPLERIMIETDAPFMQPKNIHSDLINHSNKRRNEPAFLPFVAESIAQFKQVSIQEIAEQTTLNTEAFFKL